MLCLNELVAKVSRCPDLMCHVTLATGTCVSCDLLVVSVGTLVFGGSPQESES